MKAKTNGRPKGKALRWREWYREVDLLRASPVPSVAVFLKAFNEALERNFQGVTITRKERQAHAVAAEIRFYDGTRITWSVK